MSDSDSNSDYYLDNDIDDDYFEEYENVVINYKLEEIKEQLVTIQCDIRNFKKIIAKYVIVYDDLVTEEYFELENDEICKQVTDVNNMLIFSIKKILVNFVSTSVSILKGHFSGLSINIKNTVDNLIDEASKNIIRDTLNEYREIYECVKQIKFYDTIERLHIDIVELPIINLQITNVKNAIASILDIYDAVMISMTRELDIFIQANVDEFGGFQNIRTQIMAFEKLKKGIMIIVTDFIGLIVSEDTEIVKRFKLYETEIGEKILILNDIVHHHTSSLRPSHQVQPPLSIAACQRASRQIQTPNIRIYEPPSTNTYEDLTVEFDQTATTDTQTFNPYTSAQDVKGINKRRTTHMNRYMFSEQQYLDIYRGSFIRFKVKLGELAQNIDTFNSATVSSFYKVFDKYTDIIKSSEALISNIDIKKETANVNEIIVLIIDTLIKNHLTMYLRETDDIIERGVVVDELVKIINDLISVYSVIQRGVKILTLFDTESKINIMTHRMFIEKMIINFEILLSVSETIEQKISVGKLFSEFNYYVHYNEINDIGDFIDRIEIMKAIIEAQNLIRI